MPVEKQETQGEQLTSDLFIHKLYDIIFSWINKRNGKIVAEVGPCYIGDWDSHQFQPGRSVSLNISIEKAEWRSKYASKETLGMQFGFYPKGKGIGREGRDPIELMRLFVKQVGSWGYGEFYIRDVGQIVTINCWADSPTFGGQAVGDWPQKQLLTQKGLEGCLEIVQRTTSNTFV